MSRRDGWPGAARAATGSRSGRRRASITTSPTAALAERRHRRDRPLHDRRRDRAATTSSRSPTTAASSRATTPSCSTGSTSRPRGPARGRGAAPARTGASTTPTMSALNARAKLDRVPEAEVAARLRARALRASPPRRRAASAGARDPRRAPRAPRAGRALAVRRRSWSAIPLGILAARRRRLGQVVLGGRRRRADHAVAGAAGVHDPAASASAPLPAHRGALPLTASCRSCGTPTPASRDPAGLRDSAWRWASPPGTGCGSSSSRSPPAILAGIKSAAVITVGTATLGALIGAGGLGQPIFTGIRLDDMGLILEGAIPASLLALAVQGVFELVERFLVPRGLLHHVEAERPR